VKISRPHPKVLKLTRSRTRHGFYLAITLVFLVSWYYYVLGMGAPADGNLMPTQKKDWMPTNIMEWIVLVLPLASLPFLVRCVRIIAKGEETIFDGNARKIAQNGQIIAAFDDIAQLQIRVRAGEDQSDLILVLRKGRNVKIDSASYRRIAALSESVGEILGRKAHIH
jgi:hypothetical protein